MTNECITVILELVFVGARFQNLTAVRGGPTRADLNAIFLYVLQLLKQFALSKNTFSSQEYPANAGVPQGSILGSTLILLYINDLPDDVICNIAICGNVTTLYSNCDQASDQWQQLELASELESDLRDTVEWGRKWLVDFNAGKTQLVSFDRSNNTVAIDVKMDGSALEEK